MRNLFALIVILFGACVAESPAGMVNTAEMPDCNEDFTTLPLAHACVIESCFDTCGANQAAFCGTLNDGAVCTCYADDETTLLVCAL